MMPINEEGNLMDRHMAVDKADSSDEDPETILFELDSNYSNVEMKPLSSQVFVGSGESDCLLLSHSSMDGGSTPGYLPSINSKSDLSAPESPMSLPIKSADFNPSTLGRSSYSLPGRSPLQSTSTSSSSTPRSLRRLIPRSVSDSNFKVHEGRTSVDGSASLLIQPMIPCVKQRFSIGLLRKPKKSFELSLDVHKESKRVEEGFTIPETDLHRDRIIYFPQTQGYMETPFEQHRISYSTEKPASVNESFMCKSLSQGGRSLLCSGCKQMSPIPRNIPRRFSYVELEAATNKFSESNFLAEGGFGFVYKGEQNGQKIAVKQHKLASTQGYKEFRSEVELLSCAQHRNLVMLLGCCDENGHRMLVYEYVCNKSLDWHLSPTRNPKGLRWSARLKIAIGAARALRYLHEECRVGCIVHRDMRPNNILLTHDYEPLVGDFGLARSHLEGEDSIETRIIGTFGYLAPEYAESGQISWRADVYAFGVVLLELITGRKAIDLLRPPGQQSLTEWARPRLANDAILVDLVDNRLESFHMGEMRAMIRAASLCVRKDPAMRPRMSQVLHILEGENKGSEEIVRHASELITRQASDLPYSITTSKAFEHQTSNTDQQQHSRTSFHKSQQTRKQQIGSSRKPKLLYEHML